MRRGIGRLRASGAGGGGTSLPLRFATNSNFAPDLGQYTGLSGTRLNCIGRTRIVIAGNQASLVFSFLNWNVSPSGVQLNTNAYTIVKCALEKTGGISVPVLFAGAAGRSIAAGATNIQSDPILPSSFSLAQFTSGDEYWIRLQVSVTTSGHQIPYGIPYTGDGSGPAFPQSVGWQYDPVENPTVSDVYSTGNISLGNGLGSGASYPPSPVVIGRGNGSDNSAALGFGNSIDAGANDTLTGQGFRGYFARSLVNSAFNANWIGGMNMGSSGSRAQLWTTGTNISTASVYWQYAKGIAADDFGTNNFALGDSLATTQTESQSFWTLLRAGGFNTILKLPVMPRTTSTDSWATEANQTAVNAAFGTAGAVSQYNTWLSTQISGSGITAIVPITSVQGTDPTKWLTNGVANTPTSDGIHPSAAYHALLANSLRTVMLPYL